MVISEPWTVSRQALMAYRGNRYSVPPELAATQVRDTRRLGDGVLDIVTTSQITVADTGWLRTGPGRSCAITDTSMPSNRQRWPVPRPGAGHTAAKNPSRPDPTLVPPQKHCATTPLTMKGRLPPLRRQLPTWPLRARCPRKEYPEMATTPDTATSASLYQRLRGHLATLKLHDVAEALPSVLDQAQKQGLPMTAALEQLLSIEVDATEARRLAGRLRFARLPTPASLEDFDYDAAPASTGL